MNKKREVIDLSTEEADVEFMSLSESIHEKVIKGIEEAGSEKLFLKKY